MNMQDQVASNIVSAYIALGERFNIVNKELYHRDNRLQVVQLENGTAVVERIDNTMALMVLSYKTIFGPFHLRYNYKLVAAITTEKFQNILEHNSSADLQNIFAKVSPEI